MKEGKGMIGGVGCGSYESRVGRYWTALRNENGNAWKSNDDGMDADGIDDYGMNDDGMDDDDMDDNGRMMDEGIIHHLGISSRGTGLYVSHRMDKWTVTFITSLNPYLSIR